MFGNDHDEDNNNDNVQPMSAQPVNNGLLGINDDDDADDSAPKDEPSAPPAPSSSIGGFSSDTYGDAPVSDDPKDTTTTDDKSTDDDELLDIKKEALQELSPLVDHLDQNSEEKFRTTMMMIQASDNKALIPQAFKAAKEISDDKNRAQALLDIVNEINYFTHRTEN